LTLTDRDRFRREEIGRRHWKPQAFSPQQQAIHMPLPLTGTPGTDAKRFEQSIAVLQTSIEDRNLIGWPAVDQYPGWKTDSAGRFPRPIHGLQNRVPASSLAS
jgi:hypothetical protein